ncbi:P-loop containing nucleoside triphosphate hydrolase [Sesbania bispinosa]|nr:P-loop containing nucleoside triphosphate hydrolase [Sesbania bispinosa]
MDCFILTFHEKYRDIVMERYIPHVVRTYEAMKAEKRIVNIHHWDNYWSENELSHPATFESLALDPQMKESIIRDLNRFLKRKEMYKKVGKPWKRGYLLYGPPGTGKSSLIAAMANYLKFDVYDLQLNNVHSDRDLAQAMRETTKCSIIVIEDIDCNKEVHARSSDPNCDEVHGDDKDRRTFTLSGLLNYMDGLWSGCGEERIIIFTTNHREKIDPALLRPGRMDLHINLSFLKSKAFRILATNYLDIQDHHHPLFEQIEELLEKLEVTPAVVAEQLIRNEDPDVALDGLLKFLQEIDMQKGKQID